TVRKTLVEVVKEDRPGENERSDKEKDQRIGERSEYSLRVRDLKENAESRSDQRRHRHRQGFADPKDNDRGDDRRKAVVLRLQRRHRQQPDHQKDERSEKESGSVPPNVKLAFLAARVFFQLEIKVLCTHRVKEL